MNREAKLEMLIDTFNKLMHLFDRKGEKQKVQARASYSKQPTLFPWEEQIQSLQDKNNKKNMHDEKNCKEGSEEACQVGTRYLPISCASPLRKHYKQIANRNKVECVGVPMFWLDWQDQNMRQHQNHFWALGSSPPRPGEGSLQIELRMIYL